MADKRINYANRDPLSRTEAGNLPRHCHSDLRPPQQSATTSKGEHERLEAEGKDLLSSQALFVHQHLLGVPPAPLGSPQGAAVSLLHPGTKMSMYSGPRYTLRKEYMVGDRVIVRVCEDRLGSWRHGVVANFDEHPVRLEDKEQVSYPVLYPSGSRTEMGYYNPSKLEIMYDNILSNGVIEL